MKEPETVELGYRDGYKDEYKVTVELERNGETIEWAPTNEQFFGLIELWFNAEEQAFGGDGYGDMWPLFFVALTRREGRDAAINNNKRGRVGMSPKGHFLKNVDEHGDDIIQDFEELVEEARDELGVAQTKEMEQTRTFQFMQD